MLSLALDLQSCGVTTDGATLFIEVLKLNSCLMVLDIRANALIGKLFCHFCILPSELKSTCMRHACIIDDDVIDVIHEQLTINVAGMDKSEQVHIMNIRPSITLYNMQLVGHCVV